MWKSVKSRVKFKKVDIVRKRWNTDIFKGDKYYIVISHYAHYMDCNNKCHRVHIDNLNWKEIEYFGGWYIKVRDFNGKYTMKKEEYMDSIEDSALSPDSIRDIKLNSLFI